MCSNEMLVVFIEFLRSKFEFSAMPKRIVNAKIACLDFPLLKAKMKLGVQVCVGRSMQFGYCIIIISVRKDHVSVAL